MKEEKILKLKPYVSEKIWGYEKWVLSCNENGKSIVGQGVYKDKSLDCIFKYNVFPLLIKIIKANKNLSIQVHPDNKYAYVHENTGGKDELWYILEAKPEASLICGMSKILNKEEFKEILHRKELQNYVKRIKVKKGDMIYIPSGTVHAIESGISLVEIQQNSNITYRLYDWGRGRELHVEKALDVVDYEGKKHSGFVSNNYSFISKNFSVELIDVKGNYEDKTKEKFTSFVVIEGYGVIRSGEENIPISSEECIYICDNTQYSIVGNVKLLKIHAN